ncbi:MAG TPA: peroxiredoxin-like family protein [Chitinophagaceae bacterium]|jgi:peroxiredoxin
MKKLFLFVTLIMAITLVSAQEGPKGLSVNEQAPDFSVTDQNGKSIHLKEQLKKGPVVLVFYRGFWCPYCNQHLKKLEDSLTLINSKGATLLTITPEQEEGVAKTIEKTKATYSIISDSNLAIMKAYDVAFAVSETTQVKYKEYGIDFNMINGPGNGTNLPVPAIYIINKDGKIIYRHFNKNYTQRASVAEILEHL